MLKDLQKKVGDQSRLQEKLLAEYLARCEILKDFPQPNGRHSISEHDSHLKNSEDSIQSTANHRSIRSVASSRSRSKEAGPISSTTPRPRRRPAGSGHY